MEDSKPFEGKNAKGLDIFLFWNGQCVSPPRKFHLSADELNSWENTLIHLARLEYDSTLPAIQLHTLDGKPVNGPEELIDGGTYVAVPSRETFKPSGYDQYLAKACKSRERRLSQRVSIELENKEVSKDIQTDDCNLCIPVDNVVVVKRLETDVTIQKPAKSQRPNSQQPNLNPSLKPLPNTAKQCFSGAGQMLGSNPLELSGNKVVLNKRQTNSRMGGRLPRASFAGRNLSGSNNSEIKTGPHISFSRHQSNQISKKPTTSTHFEVPESSVIKLKLPPIQKPLKGKSTINNRESRDQNDITSAIKKQDIISNKVSRPTETKTGTERIETTNDNKMKKARLSFLKKLEDVQIGKKEAHLPTTGYVETHKPNHLSNEMKNLTIDDNIKPMNANQQRTPYGAVLMELATKFVSNVPTDLEKIVGVLEQSDPLNLFNEKLQNKNSETNTISNILETTMQTSGCKQSPEENMEVNERRTVRLQSPIEDLDDETQKGLEITRFDHDIQGPPMSLSIVSTTSYKDNSMASTTSNLAGLNNEDNYTRANRDVTLTRKQNKLVNLRDLDNEIVIMQAIDDSVRKFDKINTISSKPNLTVETNQKGPDTKKSNTNRKKNESRQKSEDSLIVSFTSKPALVYANNLSEERRFIDLQAPGTTDVLKVTKPDGIISHTNIHGQKSISLQQNVVSQLDKIGKNISSPPTDAENETTNNNNPKDISVSSYNTPLKDITVLPDLDSDKKPDFITHGNKMDPILNSAEGNNIETLTSITNSQGGKNIYHWPKEESLIVNGRTVPNQIPSFLSNSHHDIDSNIRVVDATTATLLTLYKSPTENLKSTIIQNSDCANINKSIVDIQNKLNVEDGMLDRNDNMHDIDSYGLDLNGTTFRKDIMKSISETLDPCMPVSKLSCSQREKKFMVFVHRSDQVNLQVNVEVRSASGTLKSKQIVDANKSYSNTSSKKDENNDDAKLTQSKSLQSADNFVLPHTCCQKNRKVVVNKCPCCDRIAPDAANIERVTKLPSQYDIQPYYVLLPVMPPSSVTECCRRPEMCDKQVQHTESFRKESIEFCEECFGDKQKPETKRVSIVAESVLVQTSSSIICKQFTQSSSTQTEWCDMLLEARMQEDGHYTFYLPPITVLQQYTV